METNLGSIENEKYHPSNNYKPITQLNSIYIHLSDSGIKPGAFGWMCTLMISTQRYNFENCTYL
jgi:hypothetical protein